MVKVITYGSYDLLHYGHVRLLERAKALGDYLIVGVTSDDFDKKRGKINTQQPLMERVEAIRKTGIADEIIIEEYEGQKIDDILRFGVDIFTVGSDWVGKFDYLNEYCEVVYLPRTTGISSSDIRSCKRQIRLGFVGDYETRILKKFYNECKYVNGLEVSGICSMTKTIADEMEAPGLYVTDSFNDLLDRSDALFILSHPDLHYAQIREALERGKHVLCESPVTLDRETYCELTRLAKEKNLILMNDIKTAYSTAYYRLILLVKSGKIGDVVSIDATCTSLHEIQRENLKYAWNSICYWGPTALLPVFQLLGTDYVDVKLISKLLDKDSRYDQFTRINLIYPNGTATVSVGRGVKSEGELVISGTNGYIYVPSPWWKTDYFEIRYENPADNKRYFFQLEGEGIRQELVAFLKAIDAGRSASFISDDVASCISDIMDLFHRKETCIAM